jgi:hypothetical protein
MLASLYQRMYKSKAGNARLTPLYAELALENAATKDALS